MSPWALKAMRPIRNLLMFTAGLTLLAFTVGCNTSAEEAEFDPASVKLEGEPDPTIAGTWKAGTGATYIFNPDGSYSLRSDVKTQQGAFEVKVDAQWRRNGTRILLEDASKLVVPYEYKLDGNKLTLTSTGNSKTTTVLTKQ